MSGLGETPIEGSPPPAEPRRRPPAWVIAFLTSVAGAAVALTAAYGIWELSRPSMKGLPQQVMTSMNEYLDGEEQLRGVDVTAITVMRAAGNTFEGQATAKTASGSTHPVMVHIIWDGESLLWRTDPGAFLFAIQG